MAVFTLKFRDTRPNLRVLPKNPDGSPADITGSTAWWLHIWLSDGSKLFRPMVVVAVSPAELGYDWVAGDWAAVSGGGSAGGLVAGPATPVLKGVLEHRMEYEVIGPGGARLTFPNGGYDTLRIPTDIGQGA